MTLHEYIPILRNKQDATQGNFLLVINKFEFRVFFSVSCYIKVKEDSLAIECRWMLTFPKDISAV